MELDKAERIILIDLLERVATERFATNMQLPASPEVMETLDDNDIDDYDIDTECVYVSPGALAKLLLQRLEEPEKEHGGITYELKEGPYCYCEGCGSKEAPLRAGFDSGDQWTCELCDRTKNLDNIKGQNVNGALNVAMDILVKRLR
jgi:hypothetical protein